VFCNRSAVVIGVVLKLVTNDPMRFFQYSVLFIFSFSCPSQYELKVIGEQVS